MLITVFFTILKFVVVMVLLSAMVGLLLGIGQVYKNNPGEEDADSLRRDIREHDDVVSHNSVFSQFLSKYIARPSSSTDSRTKSRTKDFL